MCVQMTDLARWAGPAAAFRDPRHRALLSEGLQAGPLPPAAPTDSAPWVSGHLHSPGAKHLLLRSVWERPWRDVPAPLGAPCSLGKMGPLRRDTLCGRKSSRGNWTWGPAWNAATLATSYKLFSVSNPGISCLLPAPTKPAGAVGWGAPRATPAPLCCPGLEDDYACARCPRPLPRAPEASRRVQRRLARPPRAQASRVPAVAWG